MRLPWKRYVSHRPRHSADVWTREAAAVRLRLGADDLVYLDRLGANTNYIDRGQLDRRPAETPETSR